MLIKKFVVLGVLMCSFLQPAWAQVMIEEGKNVFSVAGGDRISKAITVHNTSKEEMDLRIYWEDFQYQAPYDGTKLFLPAGTAPGSASKWISFTPQELKMPPFSKKQVEYTINVPADVSGGHYGVLFFEKASDPLQDMTGVNIVLRTGALFFIESKDKDKRSALQDFKFEGNKLVGTFVDQGNVVLIPAMTYYIMDADGMAADRGEVQKVYVPPGASAKFEVPLLPGLKEGKYTFVINADLEEGDVVVKEIEFAKNSAGSVEIIGVRD